jgi:hypothetical protein
MKSIDAVARRTLVTIIALGCATAARGQTRMADPATPPSVIYVGATDVDPTGRSPADFGFGIDLNEQLSSDTVVTASYVRGANPGIVRAFRYGLHKSQFHAGIEHGPWRLAAGEIRSQRRLSGAPIVGDGITVNRDAGFVVGSLTITRPKHFAGDGGGHLLEGSLGVKRGGFTVRGFASDVARTSLHFSPISSIQLPQDDSELTLEDLAHLGQLLPRENRVRTGGVDSQVRRGPHTFVGRTALVEQVNDIGTQHSGIAAEGSYSFVSPRASLTASIRRLPKGLPGIELPGNSTTISTKVRVTKTFKTIARASGTESPAFGRAQSTRTLGSAAGIEFGKGAARLDLLLNYRDARTTAFRRSRTMSSTFRVPVGRVTAEGRIELGQAHFNQQTHRIAVYRASMHVDADRTSITAGVSYQDYGTSPPRARVDVSASTAWRGLVAEFGVGAGKSQLFGDEFAAWTNLDVPLPGAITLNVGVDYERWLYATSRYVTFVPDARDLASPWRVTVSLRKHLALLGNGSNQLR